MDRELVAVRDCLRRGHGFCSIVVLGACGDLSGGERL